MSDLFNTTNYDFDTNTRACSRRLRIIDVKANHKPRREFFLHDTQYNTTCDKDQPSSTIIRMRSITSIYYLIFKYHHHQQQQQWATQLMISRTLPFL